MSFLYEYMTESEHADAIEQAEFENMSMKFDHALECLRMEHAVRISNIDTEILVNEYTQEDMENLYVQEMAVFMEGVKDLWAKFKKWIHELVQKITGKRNRDAEQQAKNSDEEVELEYDPKQVPGILKKANAVLKKVIDVKKDDGSGIDPKKLATRLGIAAATGAATVGAVFLAAKKKTKVKKGELVPVIEVIDAEIIEADKIVQALPEPSGSDQEAANQLSAVKDMGSGVVNWGRGIIQEFTRKLLGGAGGGEGPKALPAGEGPKALPPASGDGEKPKASSASAGTSGAFAKAVSQLKGDPELAQAWSKMKKAGRKKGIFKDGFNLDEARKAAEAAIEGGLSEEVANKVLSFLKGHVGEGVMYEMVWDAEDLVDDPIFESTDMPDFMSEGTEFTSTLKELLDLANSL